MYKSTVHIMYKSLFII